MKRRYNHETSQWDIVLSEADYIDLWYKAYSHFRPYNLEVTYKLPWYPNAPTRFPDGFDLHQPNYIMNNVSGGIGYNDGRY